MKEIIRWAVFGGLFFVLSVAGRSVSADPVDFSRQIRPILAENCFECHGPDQEARQAELRLDTRAGMFAERDENPVVVPGRPGASELVARITSEDDDERMPLADSGKSLTVEQQKLLVQWIRQGAKYAEHWSFEKPRRPPTPQVQDATWPRNLIDNFVLARLEQQELRPAPEADRATLVRRLSLDLTGVPPSIAAIDAFVEDRAPGAYARLVDRLLASPQYGEHMARQWLDLARYADTNGYERDHIRDIWAWRDWVIHALNDDLPFDRFTIEQLAGDLLPNATASQIIATGFHRNSMLNRENGIDVEEFRVAAVKDRVETTGVAWLGLSIGCAQCHDHKFDPITQEDYYRLYAVFNQDAEELRVQDINGDRSFRSDVSPRVAASPSATTLVMRRAPQARDTHIQVRGNFLTKGKLVTPGVPSCFQQLRDGVTADRLALARWLVDPDHPRTSRVVVNRLWAHHFGRGIVETLEDLGTQSPWPTHPQLLDLLATELVHRDWSVKAMHRLMVTSATYRQSSYREPDKQLKDPRNELLSSFPRQRLSAEQIRDNALAIGGLLSHKMGGPGVFPHQPKIQSGFHGASWDESQGEDRYRRAIYTFWRRTAPYASFVTFDAPTRDICSARRIATNTALGALDLLNDPVFVDAARGLAGRMIADGGRETDQRIAHGFRLCVGRVSHTEEIAGVRKLYNQAIASYRADTKAAAELSNTGTLASQKNIGHDELAAWILVANTLLNLDETITRE